MVFFEKRNDHGVVEEIAPTGLGGMLKRTLGSVRAMVNSRMELIICEFREEKTRLASLLIFGMGAVFLGFLGLMAVTAAAAIYFYEDAFAVLMGFAAFYLLAAIGFVLVLRRRIKAPLFPETIAQLKKDREELFD